jgi:hypothetical protein
VFMYCFSFCLSWKIFFFPKIWEVFCYYFVDYVTYIFACNSSPSLMPMICSFGLLMEFQRFRILFSQLLSLCLRLLLFFSLISILPLSPEILSSTCPVTWSGFVLGRDALQHLQRFLQCVKCIILEFNPLHCFPLFPHPPILGLVSGIIFAFTYMCKHFLHHIHPPTPFPTTFPLPLVPPTNPWA